MADLQFSAGIDSTMFTRNLHAMEQEVQRRNVSINQAFGSWGKSVDSATSGIRKAQSAVSGVVGVATGLLGTWASVVSIIGAGVAALKVFEERQKEIDRRNYEDLQRRIAQQERLQDSLRRTAQLAGELTTAQSKADSIRSSFDTERMGLLGSKATIKEVETLRRIVAEYDSLSKAPDQFDPVLRGQNAIERMMRDRDRRQRLEEIRKELGGVNPSEAIGISRAMLEIDRRERKALEIESQRAVNDGLREQVRLETEAARLRGESIEASRMAERAAHSERLQRIDELDSAGATNVQTLRRLEEQNHARRLRDIDTEERRRREADERSLDIEIMRAKGLRREAEIAQVRLDIERRIRQVRDDGSLDDAQRQARVDRLRELERLSIDAAGGGPGAGDRLFGQATLGATLTGAERQIFGVGGSGAAEQQLVKTGQIKELSDRILVILQSVTSGGAIHVYGDSLRARYS